MKYFRSIFIPITVGAVGPCVKRTGSFSLTTKTVVLVAAMVLFVAIPFVAGLKIIRPTKKRRNFSDQVEVIVVQVQVDDLFSFGSYKL